MSVNWPFRFGESNWNTVRVFFGVFFFVERVFLEKWLLKKIHISLPAIRRKIYRIIRESCVTVSLTQLNRFILYLHMRQHCISDASLYRLWGIFPTVKNYPLNTQLESIHWRFNRDEFVCEQQKKKPSRLLEKYSHTVAVFTKTIYVWIEGGNIVR